MNKTQDLILSGFLLVPTGDRLLSFSPLTHSCDRPSLSVVKRCEARRSVATLNIQDIVAPQELGKLEGVKDCAC